MPLYFAPLRTKRLGIQLVELSIGDACRIGSIPETYEQEGITAFLRAAAVPLPGDANPLFDPALWTVQERTLAVSHYLAMTADDGPDFGIYDGAGHVVGRFSDYLARGADYPDDVVSLGELAGDKWILRHLTGHAAESIERLEGNAGLHGRRHWLIGSMAAQLMLEGEECPALFQDDWLDDRMKRLAAYPESDFITLLGMFYGGLDSLSHLFRLGFDDLGIHCLPSGRQEGAAVPPARFLPAAGLSEFSRTA